MLALTSCAGQSPPPRTPLPEAASVVPEPQECHFLVGPGQGVRVEDIIADSGADGVLEIGDVLTAVNNQVVASVADLRAILAEHEVGQTIAVTVERGGEPVDQSIDLGPNPDDPTRPLLGVMISTAFDDVLPEDLGSEPILTGGFARAVSVAGRLYAFDPISAEWTSLEAETPADNWIAANGRVLYLQGRDEPGSALIDPINEEQLVFEIGEWNGSNLLGTLGDKVIVSVTRPVPNVADRVEVGVMMVDFVERNANWIWQVTADSGVPVASFPSPTGSQILLLGEDPESGTLFHSLISAEGTRTGSVEVPDGFLGLGWFDERRILVGADAQGLQLVDLGGADPVPVEVPSVISSLQRVWPVGDGTHLLGETGNSLVRFALDPEAEVRTLASSCQVDLLGDPGWSS
jgi:hypothetical protein